MGNERQMRRIQIVFGNRCDRNLTSIQQKEQSDSAWGGSLVVPSFFPPFLLLVVRDLLIGYKVMV